MKLRRGIGPSPRRNQSSHAMKPFVHRAVLLFTAAVFALGSPAAPSAQPANDQASSLLHFAERLQQGITANSTAYRHKDTKVSWGDNGSPLQCYTDCSGFINAVIAKASNWKDDDFKAAFGHKRMLAYHYYEAISAGRHFARINAISSVLPGDIIALQYADRSEHEDNTGHVMLITASPRPHRPSKVLVPNTRQYEVDIIDCSKSPHGKSDTRVSADGGEYSGLGKGTLRLYVDEKGAIVGYSWSVGNPKAGFDPFENPIIIGRFR